MASVREPEQRATAASRSGAPRHAGPSVPGRDGSRAAGHRSPLRPEEELGRLTLGRPRLERRVDTLLRLFGFRRLDREAIDEIAARARRVGLTIDPPLEQTRPSDVVALVPTDRPRRDPTLELRRVRRRVKAHLAPVGAPLPKSAGRVRLLAQAVRRARAQGSPALAGLRDAAAHRRLPTVSWRRAIPIVFVVIGVALLAEAVLTVFWKEPFTALSTARKQDEAAGDLRRLEAVETRRAIHRSRVAERRYIERRAAALNGSVPNGKPVGRLRIDRIDLNYVVVQGTDTESLKKGPAHYTETPLPGARGNWTVGIAGHRTTYSAPFRPLDKLRRGDRMVVTMPYARFTYRVEGTKIVDAGYLGTFRPRNYDRLALTACHPLYSDAQRIVVYGRLADVQTRGRVRRAPLATGWGGRF